MPIHRNTTVTQAIGKKIKELRKAHGLEIEDISEMPKMVIDRVRHFFLTYKDLDGGAKNVEITHVYGKEEAFEVIKRSHNDYNNKFGNANDELASALEKLLG